MPNIYRLISFLICMAFTVNASAASAKLYVWVNKDGVLVYSDYPHPGAEEVKVKDTNVISSSIDTSILDISPSVINESYRIEITQPKNKATIRDNTGSVHISGLIKPVFKSGLLLQLYLDNKPYGQPQGHALFALRNIDRGEHTIKLVLRNDKGKVIASSKESIFYLHRASSN